LFGFDPEFTHNPDPLAPVQVASMDSTPDPFDTTHPEASLEGNSQTIFEDKVFAALKPS
jgi:hypothetical protein